MSFSPASTGASTGPSASRVAVALPMLSLVPGGMGGSETYARELTRELAAMPELDVTTYLPRAAAGFSEGVREHVVERVAGADGTRGRLESQLQSRRSKDLRRALADADVVHYPLSVPAPPAPRGSRAVVTLLDTQHKDLPELFSRAEQVYRRFTYDRPTRRASAVITISEFSKQQIVRHYGLDPDTVHVAHLGVDTSHFAPVVGEREDFVLYPARGWPHKNHGRLLEAMRLVREEVPGLRLVLTGGGLDSLGDDLPEWVDRRGLVSREELLSLYRRASVLAFPSRYEGFGLPPLEAMASGCPVAAANAGSLPEICGDAAVMFDPDDARAIARAVLDARAQGPDLAVRGLEHCREFTWKRCAEVHRDLYLSVAGR
ncbi:glycosyltransferase [Nocardioides sp. MAH-18]|uniref:Glycosyltransferase n=1 Tax=Nocardioides agri TaxID=2682843 RepID=A0A6L6XX17_9ACTN|nr:MULTISPECIES: glycosyltransferase family 1 protein [unclassified Nocardioides]MBA2952166.1 glycosyltransferase family 4 protein [Nocardioides sp. CGMCC 1.13656]MVQ51332.1 glycosyltransferase [Nocardioides sp. MAH-18]